MSLAPGETYTEIEVAIMNFLKEKRKNVRLYEIHRKTTEDPQIFYALGDIPLLDFSIKPEFNFLEPLKGTLLMKDFSAICRDLSYEDRFVTSLHEGSVRFLISQLATTQWWSTAINTQVFDINFLGIASDKPITNPRQINEDFNAMVREHRPTDIMEKGYLIFPVYVKTECYMTLIVNPKGLVKTRNKDFNGTSHMVNIGTKDLAMYKTIVVPRIFKILELFLEMNRSTGHCEYLDREKIVDVEIVLPYLPTWEKPVALLYAMDKFLHKHERITEWKRIILSIGNDKDKMIRDMKALRERLGGVMYLYVKENGTDVGKHLVEKREQIVMHRKRQILLGREQPDDPTEIEGEAEIHERDRQLQTDRNRSGHLSIY